MVATLEHTDHSAHSVALGHIDQLLRNPTVRLRFEADVRNRIRRKGVEKMIVVVMEKGWQQATAIPHRDTEVQR